MRFTPRRTRRPTLALSLASMLDATFLLLAYFLVTAAIDRPEERLAAGLLGGGRIESANLEAVRLEVGAEDGITRYLLGARVIADREELAVRLAELDPRTPLRIVVRPGPPVSAVTAAIQSARDAGIETVAYEPAE